MAGYTFGSIAFGPRMGDLAPMPSPVLNSTVRHLPYSNTDIVDLGGRSARMYRAAIRVAPSDVGSMETALGTTATLTLYGTSFGSATLIELSNRQTSYHLEYTFYDAVWLVP